MTHDDDDARQLQSDSAGIPWHGRHFEANTFATDSGEAPPKLIEALRRFAAGGLSPAEVVWQLSAHRVLIPLVAALGDSGVTEQGRVVDKSAELSTVTALAPDGLPALPVFTSTAAMAVWNPRARPVPADGPRVALAVAGEGTTRIVVDPGSDTEFVVRRTAFPAMATGRRWVPPYEDERVLAAFMEPASEYPIIRSLLLMPGDPTFRLAGPEVLVQLDVLRGLDAAGLKAITDELTERWQRDPLILERVDSIGVRLTSSQA